MMFHKLQTVNKVIRVEHIALVTRYNSDSHNQFQILCEVCICQNMGFEKFLQRHAQLHKRI